MVQEYMVVAERVFTWIFTSQFGVELFFFVLEVIFITGLVPFILAGIRRSQKIFEYTIELFKQFRSAQAQAYESVKRIEGVLDEMDSLGLERVTEEQREVNRFAQLDYVREFKYFQRQALPLIKYFQGKRIKNNIDVVLASAESVSTAGMGIMTISEKQKLESKLSDIRAKAKPFTRMMLRVGSRKERADREHYL